VRQFIAAFARVFPYVRPYWKLAAISAVLTVGSAGFGLLAPWPMKIIVDSVFGTVPLPHLVQWMVGPGPMSHTRVLVLTVLGGFMLTVVSKLVGVFIAVIDTRVNLAVSLDVRSDLFQQAQRLSVTYNDTVKTGQLLFVLNLSTVVISLLQVAPALAYNIVMLGGMFWIAFRLSPQLALLSLAVVPFLYLSGTYYTQSIRNRLAKVQGTEMQVMNLIHQSITMLRVIVAFGREDHEFERFRDEAQRAADARVMITLQQSLFSLAVEATTAAGTALVLGYGSYMVLSSRLTIGELLIVISYIGSVFHPLQTISGTMGHLQEQLVGLRLVLGLLNQTPNVQEAPDATPIERCEGRVVFEQVSFHYEGREGTLQDVSFDVSPGEAIAIEIGRAHV
jgi:ATP-binding cassette subfamily B protein